jgi:hypothetical protein
MKKAVLITAIAALLAWPNRSSIALAAPPQASEEAGTRHSRNSPEDFAASADARIAALKKDLKLTPAQEQYWFALAAVLREEAKHGQGARQNGVKKPRDLTSSTT